MDLEDIAVPGLLITGGAVHAFPHVLTGLVNDDLVPQVGQDVTVQRGVGVASLGYGVVEAMEALDGMR